MGVLCQCVCVCVVECFCLIYVRSSVLFFETKNKKDVDYLKYDNCNNDGIPPQTRYPIMRDALNQTGRQIFYSMCEWGQDAR
jgi:alpha-galactosidase